MKMKILQILTVIMTFFTACTTCAKAEVISFDTPITLKVNGKYIKTDSEPFLHNGLTYVPIRFVSDALCAKSVRWESDTSTAVIRTDKKEIELRPDSKTAVVNGKKVAVSGSVLLVKDRVYVPVRFVSENMESQVLWDSGTYTVDIYKD